REFASVKDAESAAIDKRIDNILGQSFSECIKTIKSILSAPKPFLADCIVDLNEIFQRRHVHVHSGGHVDNKYLALADARKGANLKVGDTLTVDDTYLQQAINISKLAMLLMANQLWMKVDPASDSRDSQLTVLAYDEMVAGRWAAAEAIYAAFMSDKKVSAECRQRARVIYWLCRKRQGHYDEVRGEIQKADFS